MAEKDKSPKEKVPKKPSDREKEMRKLRAQLAAALEKAKSREEEVDEEENEDEDGEEVDEEEEGGSKKQKKKKKPEPSPEEQQAEVERIKEYHRIKSRRNFILGALGSVLGASVFGFLFRKELKIATPEKVKKLGGKKLMADYVKIGPEVDRHIFVLQKLLDGNIPEHYKKFETFEIKGKTEGVKAEFKVATRPLCIGTDNDYFEVNLDGSAAAAAAKLMGWTFSTSWLENKIYERAREKLMGDVTPAERAVNGKKYKAKLDAINGEDYKENEPMVVHWPQAPEIKTELLKLLKVMESDPNAPEVEWLKGSKWMKDPQALHSLRNWNNDKPDGFWMARPEFSAMRSMIAMKWRKEHGVKPNQLIRGGWKGLIFRDSKKVLQADKGLSGKDLEAAAEVNLHLFPGRDDEGARKPAAGHADPYVDYSHEWPPIEDKVKVTMEDGKVKEMTIREFFDDEDLAKEFGFIAQKLPKQAYAYHQKVEEFVDGHTGLRGRL